MNTSLMRSPLLDWKILQLFRQYGENFDPSAVLKFISEQSLHKKVYELGPSYYNDLPENIGPFKWDSIIGDHTSAEQLEEFKKKNNFSLDIPVPREPKLLTVFLTAAAVLDFITQWPVFCSAKKREYTISPPESFLRESMVVEGFELNNLRIGTMEGKAVAAMLSLPDGFSIVFSDMSAFIDDGLRLRNHEGKPSSLVNLELKSPLYWHRETNCMWCPSVDVSYTALNHLVGASFINESPSPNKLLEQIVITQSELLGKLKLSEWGVAARVEVVARGEMLITACVEEYTGPPPLIIEKGLVMKIFYGDRELMCAYVPQEEFKTT